MNYPIQRRYFRVPVLCFVTIRSREQQGPLPATAINEGGLVLLNGELPPESQAMQMSIELPDSTRITAVGEPRARIPGVGIGFAFTGIEPVAVKKIAQLVKAFHQTHRNDVLFPMDMEPETHPSEKRRSMRILISFAAMLEDEILLQRGRVRDVSERGVCVLVKKPYDIGERLIFTGPRERFAARMVVRNCIAAPGCWRVGMEVVETYDDWIIS